MKHSNTISFFRNTASKRNKIIAIFAAITVASIGYALVMTRASGFFASIMPATASLSGNATLVVDAQTGKAIQFNAPVVQPPVTPPTGERVCPAFPAFPNANCTGVPAGVSLTPISGSFFSTSKDGEVIDGKSFSGEVFVTHKNVVIKNSRIKGRITYQTSGANGSGLIIKDSDIGPDACPATTGGGFRLLNGNDFTLLRSHLHHNDDDHVFVSGGGKALIQDSIVDKGCFYPNDHLDAIQVSGGLTNLTISHSIVDARPVNSTDKGNAAVFWANKPDSGSRLTVDHSLLSGGQVTLAPYDATANSGVIIDINNNRFIRNSYGVNYCSYGTSVISVLFNGTSGIKWTNNAFDDGTPLPACS